MPTTTITSTVLTIDATRIAARYLLTSEYEAISPTPTGMKKSIMLSSRKPAARFIRHGRSHPADSAPKSSSMPTTLPGMKLPVSAETTQPSR